MSENANLLAFDIGTTGAKTVLIDTVAGVVVDTATASYPLYFTPDGGAEQSPEDWWRAVASNCRELAERRPRAMARVAAIGCGGMMNGVVLVDSGGRSLRNSILHADVRSAPQTSALAEAAGVDAIFAATYNRPDCHLSLPKMMWLRENESDVLAKAAFMVQSKDYIVGRLTGVTGMTDPSDASLTGGFDVANRTWVTDLWRQAGIDTRLLPEVVPSTQIVGSVTQAAAAELGLTAGIPVVMGGGDGACATAGSGVGPGEAYLYLGGTAWIGLNSDHPIKDSRISSYCNLDQRLTVFGTVQSAGSSLEWFSAAFGGDTPPSHRALDDLAANISPGNLFYLPYLQGERAPLWDARARGVFFGLAPSHGQAEMYRAVLEGVGYALSSILDVFAENGEAPPALRLLGGGAKSGLWRDILAGMFNRRLETVAGVSAATSLGAAMAAGVGVGIFSDFAEAASRLVRITEVTTPQAALVAAYAPRAAFFNTLYPVLKDRFEALAEIA